MVVMFLPGAWGGLDWGKPTPDSAVRSDRKCRGGFLHWTAGWELVIPCPYPSPTRGCVFLNLKYLHLATMGTILSLSAAKCKWTFTAKHLPVTALDFHSHSSLWTNSSSSSPSVWCSKCESQWFRLEVCGLACSQDADLLKHKALWHNSWAFVFVFWVIAKR